MKTIFTLDFNGEISPQSRIDNEYINLVISSWFELAAKSENEKVYRLVFPKGSGKKLMLHASGELKGLGTTSVISDGRIQATAGLEEAFEHNEYKLLSFALFGLVENHLKNIDFLVQKAIQIKQMEIKAKFERITYVLKSTFDILPELLVDKSLQAPYLNQIIDSNSNCYEMYVLFKEQFKIRCDEIAKKNREDNSCYQMDNRLHHLKSLMNDNVFAALERFAFGKICEVFLSNNFTSNYIKSAQDQLLFMVNELIEIIKTSTPHEERFRAELKNKIDYQQLSNSERNRLEGRLVKYVFDYNEIIETLKYKLQTKTEGLDILSKYIDDCEIQLCIKDGAIYIEK